MKTKSVSGVDLGFDCFAYGNAEDPKTWKLPLFIPGNESLTRNHIKNAVYRFASANIPDADRADVWRMIAGAAKAHGIKAGPQPASVLPGSTHPETAKTLDADELELKESVAVAALRAERLIEQIGNWWDR